MKLGDDRLSGLGEALQSDERFADAALCLDFKRYEIEMSDSACRARIELMGATMVSIACR